MRMFYYSQWNVLEGDERKDGAPNERLRRTLVGVPTVASDGASDLCPTTMDLRRSGRPQHRLSWSRASLDSFHGLGLATPMMPPLEQRGWNPILVLSFPLDASSNGQSARAQAPCHLVDSQSTRIRPLPLFVRNLKPKATSAKSSFACSSPSGSPPHTEQVSRILESQIRIRKLQCC